MFINLVYLEPLTISLPSSPINSTHLTLPWCPVNVARTAFGITKLV